MIFGVPVILEPLTDKGCNADNANNAITLTFSARKIFWCRSMFQDRAGDRTISYTGGGSEAPTFLPGGKEIAWNMVSVRNFLTKEKEVSFAGS